MRGSRGYTLIELLLVIAVLAVASVVTVPAVGRAVDGIRVRAEVSGVVSFLRSAREQAVTRGQAHEVIVDVEGRALVARRGGGEPPAAFETRRPLSALLQITPVTGRVVPPIRFLPHGRSTGGSFRIDAAGARAYLITVDALTGRVTTKRVES